jgi:hypothetical protein
MESQPTKRRGFLSLANWSALAGADPRPTEHNQDVVEAALIQTRLIARAERERRERHHRHGI